MLKMLRRLPVKTRLPMEAWLLAGVVTLYSLATSLAQLSDTNLQAAGPTVAKFASLMTFSR
jgi:hypothetical protein